MQDTTRRSFMSRLGAAVTAFGGGVATASAQTRPAATPFRSTRHAQDNWLDRPGKHRVIIDAVTANGAGEAILYANNLYVANNAAYTLGESDLAIVICMRHFATPLAFGDAFWAKYGPVAGEMLKFSDPKTQKPPVTNLYNSPAYGLSLPNLGNTLSDVIKRGTHVAICDMATHFFSGEAAKVLGTSAEAIYKDCTSSNVAGSRFVSAGVVAVTRAQERGYTLIYAG
ncbi:MAG: hypothetical protein HY047_13650 [Acidobacteria bacterium]|nr:hypothetical protein [Acidobacteriota bacterium]